MYHGTIECGSIMFSRDGQIKLGKLDIMLGIYDIAYESS